MPVKLAGLVDLVIITSPVVVVAWVTPTTSVLEMAQAAVVVLAPPE